MAGLLVRQDVEHGAGAIVTRRTGSRLKQPGADSNGAATAFTRFAWYAALGCCTQPNFLLRAHHGGVGGGKKK